MKTTKKTIQAFFLFLATITTYTFTINTNHQELRKSLNNGYVTENGTIQDPSITVTEKIPQGTRYGVCHNYAISKLLDLKGLIPETFIMKGDGDWYDEFNFLEDYCQKVSEPHNNDLAIYKNEKGQIRHTGLVVDANTIESKWGTCEPTAVLHHPPLTSPSEYGEAIEYYRLITAADVVIKDMKKKTARSYNTQRSCRIVNDWLIHHATNSWIDELKFLLEADMCADVNNHNTEQQSLLMIAAKNNDIAMVDMLLNYKADTNKQDIYGNTALHLAAKNGSGTVMRALYKRNCNKKLKDKQGLTALDHYRDYASVCP